MELAAISTWVAGCSAAGTVLAVSIPVALRWSDKRAKAEIAARRQQEVDEDRTTELWGDPDIGFIGLVQRIKDHLEGRDHHPH